MIFIEKKSCLTKVTAFEYKLAYFPKASYILIVIIVAYYLKLGVFCFIFYLFYNQF